MVGRRILGATPDFVNLAFREGGLEPINDAVRRLLRIGHYRLSDFQLSRSFKNNATQFGGKTRPVSSQYPVQQIRQNCNGTTLILEVFDPLKNPDDGWIWQ